DLLLVWEGAGAYRARSIALVRRLSRRSSIQRNSSHILPIAMAGPFHWPVSNSSPSRWPHSGGSTCTTGAWTTAAAASSAAFFSLPFLVLLRFRLATNQHRLPPTPPPTAP